jgi:hypothetical protein
MDNIQEKMLKDENDRLYAIHETLIFNQRINKKYHSPEWNFGFPRKCPLCGKSLRKIVWYKSTYCDSTKKELFICDEICEYKYAFQNTNSTE